MNYQSTVLAIVNQKGGVGKSTTASIIAEAAAINYGLNVIIVDLDMQCNSSDYWVGMEPSADSVGGQIPPKHPEYEDGDPFNERSSIADIFYGKAVLPYGTYISQENGYKGMVDIMLGHPALLEEVNTEYDNQSGMIATAIINRLAEFLHSDDVNEAYDLVVLDTGPSRNPIFRAALRAATHAIIPFEPEEKSLQGINAMLHARSVENMSRVTNELQLIGLLPNKVRINTNLHQSTLDSLYDQLDSFMAPKGVYLPQSTAFPERDITGIDPKSIFEIRESHKARQAATEVADWVLKSMDFKKPRAKTKVSPRGTPKVKVAAGEV